MQQSIEERYRKLSSVEHVLVRPGMYVGNINPHSPVEWVYNPTSKKMEKREITYSPAFIKIFDEIISNSVDESKRKGSHLNEIKVDIDDDGWITIWDNGGIPVVLHKEHNQYVPEFIFSELKAGSNFDDNEENLGAGQNGVGSTLTNIFSKKFVVETADGKNRFKQTFENNLSKRSTPDVKPSDKNYTKISYLPDYERLKCKLDKDTKLKLFKRVVDIAGTNPNLKIKLNNETIKINSFEDYICLYTDEYEYEESKGWRVGIGQARDGFENVSFVNSAMTREGTHIDHVVNQVTSAIRLFIQKKHGEDVKPSEIKKYFFLFVDCEIDSPRFDAQTKEKLINKPENFSNEYKASNKFIAKMLKSPIIQEILIDIENKAQRKLLEEEKKLNKDADKKNLKKIVKLNDANSSDREKCMLFLCEGDSAKNFVLTGYDPEYMAAFPLKGKPINVDGIDYKTLLNNEEFKNIVSIIGLQLGQKVTSAKDIRYGRIIITSDADLDGAHIAALLINMFYKFWPELFKLRLVARFMTAIVRVVYKKEELKFYSLDEYTKWQADKDPKDYKTTYYKGLGTSDDEEVEGYFKNIEENLVDIISSDALKDSEALGLAFDKTRADDRKKWLDLV